MKYNLVCIHGNSLSPQVFDDFEVEGCQKILITLPGHDGRKIGSVKSWLDLVDAVYHDIKGIENAVIVGHSLGGHVAQHLLDRIKPVALFSVAAPPLSDLASVSKAFDPHPFLGYLFQNSINPMQANELARSMLKDNHPKIEELSQMIMRTTPEIRSIIGASMTRGEFKNEVNLLRQYQGKKILIYPTMDNFVSENYVKSLNIAPVKDIHGAHALPMDNAKALSSFIQMVMFGS